MAYGADFLTGGTPTADSHFDVYVASRAFDDDTGKGWLSDASAFPHWVKYDLGAGVTKRARKLRIYSWENQIDAFTLEGSNDDSNWTELLADNSSAAAEWNEWTFDNPVNYRYYRVTITSNHSGGGDTYGGVMEIELMEGIITGTRFNRGFN